MQIHPLSWTLIAVSLSNAFYTLTRTRKYRLFEADVEVKPSTPSVRRVNVDSSPGSNSPLRYFADMMTPESAASRAHPDKTKDVWELSVWDPLPISVRLFCLFSPGHVLVYVLFFPLAALDPRPSVSVLNALMMQVILSAQMLFLASRFAQQAKDNAIVQKEVMHEYDTKFVHPRLHPIVRDVGTQFSEDSDSGDTIVEIGTPATLIKRSFYTNPNPNYTSHVGKDAEAPLHNNIMRPQMFTPPTASRRSDAFTPAFNQRASASRKSLPAGYTPSGNATTSTGTTTATNFGGSTGVYSHQKSPLKKAISMNDINSEQPSPRSTPNRSGIEDKRTARQSSHGRGSPNPWTSMPSIKDLGPQNQAAKRTGAPYERFPSRY